MLGRRIRKKIRRFFKRVLRRGHWHRPLTSEYVRLQSGAQSYSDNDIGNSKLDLSVAVVAWDIGHNCVGRAYMLAEVLQRVVRHVVLLGFQYPRYGDKIWEPIRNAKIPIIPIPGENFPEFLNRIDALSERIQVNVVVACKPRLPSLELGALIKRKHGSLLILDIDDHELSFFPDHTPLTVDAIRVVDRSGAAALVEPYEAIWTRICETLVELSDGRLVSNNALRNKFGGVLLPHVRDERVFSPKSVDRKAARKSFGVPDKAHVVLFMGTPRRHKGLQRLAKAVGKIRLRNTLLVVAGTISDRSLQKEIVKVANGKVKFIPDQPFDMVPAILSMADVVCLPQDMNHPISKFQLPAKAIDAVAMSVPLLVSPTPPLQDLIDFKLAQPIDENDLEAMLANALSARSHSLRKMRKRFLTHFSYRSATAILRTHLKEWFFDTKRTPTSSLDQLIDEQRRLFRVRQGGEEEASDDKTDFVLFWKQNDSGIYGRRIDQTATYLASRQDVGKVLVIDAPISDRKLRALRGGTAPSHDRRIYTRTYEKHFGLADTNKIRTDVFVYDEMASDIWDEEERKRQFLCKYVKYLHKSLERHCISPKRAVFIMYPKNFQARTILETFRPAVIACDIVDDHRTWPDQTKEEINALTENYRSLLEVADFAFANCEPVRDAMSTFFPAIQLVPNGCEPSGKQDSPVDSAAWRSFSAIRCPIIGFVGNLEPKIDIDLLEKIARRFPDCHLALLGSTHANPDILRLSRHSNVHFYGVVPRNEVAAWASRFRVAIIPHRDMAMTRSMNPLKFYDYASWRLPIVSTAISNIAHSSGFVRVGQTHEAFLSCLAEALRDPKIDNAELDAFIRENSWEQRLSGPISTLLASVRNRSCGHGL